MFKTTLNRRSNFFIDAFNVLFHTDLFLFNELYYRISNGDIFLKSVFKNVVPEGKYRSDNKRDISIVQKSAGKKNQNILLDFIDRRKYNESNSNLPIETFVAKLYYEFLSSPSCPEYLQLTEFGSTIKILTTDANFDKLYIYVPFISDFIRDNIVEAFTGVGISKVSIVIGNKSELIKSTSFDTFVFENVSDVDSYLTSIGKRVEVLIPSYEYNLMEDRAKIERLMEQVTYQRLKLKENNSFYRDKNIIINTIGVPL